MRTSTILKNQPWSPANGHDLPLSEVHWTDHGTSHHHTNPHQHAFEYNPNKGGWVRKGPTPYHSKNQRSRMLL